MAEAERARQISISSYDPQASVSMTVLVSVLLIVVLVLYINILHVPLHVGGYPERVISVSRRRRRFLHAAAWGIGIGIAYTLVPRRFPFHYLAVGKPRFRREESVGQMEHLARLFAGKFELHKRSRALHYVNRAGWVIGGVAPSAANMTLLVLAAVAALLQAPPAADEPFKRGPVALLPLADTLAGKKGEAEEEEKPAERSRRRRLRHAAPHVPAARRGPLAEYAALMLVHGGDIPGGIKVLWGAIEHDTIYKKGRGGRPDRRLYELLAGLAVRSSSSADLLRLDDHVGAHWRDDELDIRRTVWCAPASRWRSRWTGKGFPWKPPHEKGERRGAA